MGTAARNIWDSLVVGIRVRYEAASAWALGVGDGNRTRNVRSHSPVLCQLSYSHRILSIIATVATVERDKLGAAQDWSWKNSQSVFSR
jgi:hypothetical protein